MERNEIQGRPRHGASSAQFHASDRTGDSGSAKPNANDLARFFRLSRDLLCIATFDGYFRCLNPAWTERLGWPMADLRRKRFMDFVHPDDRASTWIEVKRLRAGAETVLFQNRYRHRDGSYLWLTWNARAEPSESQIYATARDVTRQKRLEQEVLEVIDREQQRLGRELHDGLCQNLAGIAALSTTLSRRLEARSTSQDAAIASEIAQLLRQSVDLARDLARGLVPVSLNESGLGGAFEALALNVEHLFGVSCKAEYDLDQSLMTLSGEVEAHLFRIAQEAVNNAITHGLASEIVIRVCRVGTEGILTVRDDGLGLSDDTDDSGGLGLKTMAYRASLIGGSLKVRRLGRRGTEVLCGFPLLEFRMTPEE